MGFKPKERALCKKINNFKDLIKKLNKYFKKMKI